jgi:phospholipid/cholesterol/gamma-HCH transport system permease protein
MKLFETLGSHGVFLFQVFRAALSAPVPGRVILAQVATISERALPLVLTSGIFVGAILVLQLQLILAKYDAQSLLGGICSSTLIREVGPLIISFLLAGKVGAFTTAELGSMAVTEQLEAMKCLGTDPIQSLVVPRWIGIFLSSQLLLGLGLGISIAGAMACAVLLFDLNSIQFFSSLPQFISGSAFFESWIKSATYGGIVATVSCYQGIRTSGGAQGVGRSVTRAATLINLGVVLANFFINTFLEAIQSLWRGLS